MAEECVLYDRECIDCGECGICDLDENKRCDDCGKCLESTDDFRTVDAFKFFNDQQKKNK